MVEFDYPQGATPLDPNKIEGLGSASLNNAGDDRGCYIRALQAADGADCGPLMEFVRS